MKLLENTTFDSLSTELSVESENIRICGSLECYSCKMTGQDKRLYKNLNAHGQSPNDLEALSPPESLLSISPTAYHKVRSMSMEEDENVVISSTCNRKTLFYLIATLNASFQDYDFSNAKSEEFSREPSLQWVIESINSNLSTAIGEPYAKMSSRLWSSIDEQISLQDCSIYSYNPDLESDPFGEEGSLWSFNYFFFNQKMKRIVFFNCRASSSFLNILI
ncbi:repressor of RNA polymerase III transcription MAF1 homolog isoform X2 [Rhopilema esculentum]|uniref:repressor of RNA polymerase III transcription MAF1 homolog isoform X2 n=1 Tax=Rhopilema esculentum TaxID=499914 RepID=UPI0031D13B26